MNIKPKKYFPEEVRDALKLKTGTALFVIMICVCLFFFLVIFTGALMVHIDDLKERDGNLNKPPSSFDDSSTTEKN